MIQTLVYLLQVDDDMDYGALSHQSPPKHTKRRLLALKFRKSAPATITRPVSPPKETEVKQAHNSFALLSSDSDTSFDDSVDNQETVTEFYKGDTSLPVYTKGVKTGIPTRVFLGDLYSTQYEKATKVPLCVQSNVAFLYDINSLGHPKDILCDACGVWRQTNSRKMFFRLEDNNIMDSTCDEFGKTNIVKVTRMSYIHSTSKDFHRIVIFVSKKDNSGTVITHAACQYFFEDVEHNIEVAPHGRSKKNKPFYRTFESTKDSIKENLGIKKPKQLVHDILSEKGGISNISAPGEHARDRKQISNFLHNKKDSSREDCLLEVMDLCKTQARNPTTSFVKEVIASPELTIFMTTDQQLKDIERFCTNLKNFSILGVDATYNVGEYYLTLTTYRNLMLSTKKGQYPVFIGPALLHQKKLFDSYFSLPSMMVKYRPNLNRILVYGSDGEKNICDAFDACFPLSTHLLCDIHMKDNIIQKLSDLGIRGGVSKTFTRDIFGNQVGDVKYKGLVDCSSPAEFDEKLTEIRNEWEQRHKEGGQFYEYFLTYKSDYIKNSMTADIREMAGLGFPPRMYNQNANECANSVIKRDLDVRKISIKEATLHLQQLIQRQYEEVKLAMIGRGEWEVRNEYKDMFVPEVKYYRMTPLQKNKAEERFLTCQTRDDTNQESKGDSMSSTSSEQTSKAITCNMSITAEQSQIVSIPFPIVEEMFKKASSLLDEQSNIVPAPGFGGRQHLVLSRSSSEPHTVRTIGSGNQYACDKTCIKWSTSKICSHTLAVAEMLGKLRPFLNWYNSNMKKPNYTSLANMDMPQGRGKKATKATQRRKGSMIDRPDVIHYKSVTESSNKDQQDKAKLPKPSLPNPTPGSYILTLLRFCHENTNVCYGCKGGLKDNGIPNPPGDFVVVTKGQRQFFKNDGSAATKLGNMYFHFNEVCIRKYNAYYISCLLRIPNDVKGHLTDVHTDFLKALNISTT